MGFIELYFGKNGIDEKITLDDVDAFIREANSEGINLEYKAPSENFKNDADKLAETIGAFLNTNGGLLAYGISVKRVPLPSKRESRVVEKQYPHRVESCNPALTKERLQQLLLPRVEPWNTEIRILEVAVSSENKKHIFLIEVPQSNEAPHMGCLKFQFRTEAGNMPMTYRQVSNTFIANRAERSELVKNVYGPIYMELDDFLRRRRYEKRSHRRFDIMYHNFRYFWVLVDRTLRRETEEFYNAVKTFNADVDKFRETVKELVNREVTQYLRQIHELPIHMKSLTQEERNRMEVSIAILKDSGRELLNPKDLWVYLTYIMKPEEEFRKKYPNEKILGIVLKIDFDRKTMWLESNQSNELYERCQKTVEDSPVTISFRKSDSKLRNQATMLREVYHGLLSR